MISAVKADSTDWGPEIRPRRSRPRHSELTRTHVPMRDGAGKPAARGPIPRRRAPSGAPHRTPGNTSERDGTSDLTRRPVAVESRRRRPPGGRARVIRMKTRRTLRRRTLKSTGILKVRRAYTARRAHTARRGMAPDAGNPLTTRQAWLRRMSGGRGAARHASRPRCAAAVDAWALEGRRAPGSGRCRVGPSRHLTQPRRSVARNTRALEGRLAPGSGRRPSPPDRHLTRRKTGQPHRRRRLVGSQVPPLAQRQGTTAIGSNGRLLRRERHRRARGSDSCHDRTLDQPARRRERVGAARAEHARLHGSDARGRTRETRSHCAVPRHDNPVRSHRLPRGEH